MAFEHLAGCDFHHTRRQPCRSSTHSTAATETGVAGAEMRPPIPLPRARFGCGSFVLAAFVLPLFLVTAAIADCVALDRLGWVDFGDPNFVGEVKPAYAHSFYVNRCCGGSLSGTEPYQIFYGSDQPFSTVAQHYLIEMKSRGFTMWQSQYGIGRGRPYYGFAKRGWDHCFTIEPYSPSSNWFGVPPGKLDGLKDLPYAYVATYIRVCDGSMVDEWPGLYGNPLCLTTVDDCEPYRAPDS